MRPTPWSPEASPAAGVSLTSNEPIARDATALPSTEPDALRDRRHPVLVDDEEHVVARGRVAARWGGDAQAAAARYGMRQFGVPLIHIVRVRDRRRADPCHPGDGPRVGRPDGEGLVVADAGRRRRDRGARSRL